jgi:hypothetical protein
MVGNAKQRITPPEIDSLQVLFTLLGHIYLVVAFLAKARWQTRGFGQQILEVFHH